MNETVSPSASVALPGAQVRVSSTPADVGVRLTSASAGGVLSIETSALPAGPSDAQVANVRDAAGRASGAPVRIDAPEPDDPMQRARVVRNTVELDPEAPTLAEVREMIDEAVREAEKEGAKAEGGASASSDLAPSQL